MPDKRREPEIEALEAVYAALKPLSAEERTKVLASTYALLGIHGTEVVVAAPTAPRPAPGSGPPITAEAPMRSSVRPLSINELLHEKSPGTNAQRIALFAYYRDKHEGVPRFTRDDLKGYFANAKEPPPTNFDRDFVEAVKKGWIHEDGADSYVTSKGIEAVESAFPGERKYTKRPGRPRKPGKAKPKEKGRRKNRGAPK